MSPGDSPSQPPLRFFARLLDNPVVLKELKGRMRGARSFVLLAFYLAVIGFMLLSVYLVFWVEGSSAAPEYRQIVGKSLFGAVVLMELLMIGFIAPALTSGAIAAERERQTFDLLRVSLLSPWELTLGKLGSALAYLFLLMFAALPAQSFAFFLGGVGAAEGVVSALMLGVTAVFYCALGLFFSSFSRRILVSTVLAYGSHAFSFIFFFFAFFFLSLVSSMISNATGIAQELYAASLWLLFSLNPLFAAVVSEAMLIEDQALFFTTNNVFGSGSFPLPAPWLIYVLFYAFLSLLLIGLSAYFVSRAEN